MHDQVSEPAHPLRGFWRLAGGFWGRGGPPASWLFSSALLLVVVLGLAASYGMNVWYRVIFDALQGRESDAVLSLSLAFAWYSVRLAWQSYQFHDISTGTDATPLWIPQLAMACGSLILAVALLDALLEEWRGRRMRAAPAAPLHNE